jgi:hypothetical protein
LQVGRGGGRRRRGGGRRRRGPYTVSKALSGTPVAMPPLAAGDAGTATVSTRVMVWTSDEPQDVQQSQMPKPCVRRRGRAGASAAATVAARSRRAAARNAKRRGGVAAAGFGARLRAQ